MEALRTGARGATAVVVELMGRLGLRPAEARAVLWREVRLDAAELDAGPRLNRRNERIGPKTKAAERTLALDQAAVDLLTTWRTEQVELCRAAGAGWTEIGGATRFVGGVCVEACRCVVSH
jgi:hypothetical protein